MSHISKLPIRIYYEDTDAQNVVYHGRYINFGERGRAEYLRDLGFEIPDLVDTMDLFFIARHAEIDYLKPAHFNDLLMLETSIESIRNTSFIVTHNFIKNDEKIAVLKVTIVCVSATDFKPMRVPEEIREKISK